ncbi:MAG: putative zinc-binding protein [Euryarchaeota archaeon]|nr:putative zinc-binding protein [Euryarchaeota archaeon]MBV1730417.1 putative zinc-binding protein [Methanobacterium sp.]MBU4547790.1 putative zinc-binding protein [Euryarchaeota archaeon]MBU4607686.1 putative zinc-binding protein [Euryarchaeota archaeon]MBV1755069.1 putative zinc-binding protein [Methanobacterium sp.]
MKDEKIALCPCNGMSPYGLIARAASSDMVEESSDKISICITATSADKESFRNLIKKYPIIAVNGCEHGCVDQILKSKGVQVAQSMNVMGPLQENKMEPGSVARLGDSGEKCVVEIKKKIENLLDE